MASRMKAGRGPYSDPVMGRLVTEGLADADGFLLGRQTHDILSNYWPKVTAPDNPIATALNSRSLHIVRRAATKTASLGEVGRAGSSQLHLSCVTTAVVWEALNG